MLTSTQFAKSIGKKRQWINEMIKQGRIKPPPSRVGKYYLFKGNEKIIDKHKPSYTGNNQIIRYPCKHILHKH